MTRLKDMEEMIESIHEEHLKDFMKEAYLSYMAGAYRSVIIVSSIAVYEDLRIKTEQLSRINPEAKSITKEVKKLMDERNPFEKYIEDQLVSKNILSSTDSRNLVIIRDRRNLSAHPTDHKVTAEEARYIYCLCIGNFLSKPVLYANEQIDFIIKDLKNDYYFPQDSLSDIEIKVKNSIQCLHKGSYPYLIKVLFEKIDLINEPLNNYGKYLLGLIKLSKNSDVIRDVILKYMIEEKSNNSSYRFLLTYALSINPSLYLKSNSDTKSRLKKFLSEYEKIIFEYSSLYINNVIVFLEGIIESNNTYLDEFKTELEDLITYMPYNNQLVNLAVKDDELKELLVKEYISNADNQTFNISNELANNMERLDSLLANRLKPKDCFNIFIAMIKGRNRGSDNLEVIISSKFNKVSNMKLVVSSFITDDIEKAKAILEDSSLSESVELFRSNYLEKNH